MGLRIQVKGNGVLRLSIGRGMAILLGCLVFFPCAMFALSPAISSMALSGVISSNQGKPGNGIEVTFTTSYFERPGTTAGKVEVVIKTMEGLSLSDVSFQCSTGLYLSTHKIVQQEKLVQHQLEVLIPQPGEYLLTVEASAQDAQGQGVGPVRRLLYFYADADRVECSEAGILDAHIQALKWHLAHGQITQEDYDRQLDALHEGKI